MDNEKFVTLATHCLICGKEVPTYSTTKVSVAVCDECKEAVIFIKNIIKNAKTATPIISSTIVPVREDKSE